MPFPLAHPAAVLPLRRYCPRYLSLPALVAGSVAPDVAYFLSFLKAEEWSHSAWGIVGFALPVGLVGLVSLYWIDTAARRFRPDSRFWERVPRLPSFGAPVAILLSLLIGGATHFLWDSFTHRDGWVVERISYLQVVVGHVGNRSVRVCHLLWYFFSFIGVVWVWMASEDWILAAHNTSRRGARSKILDATVFAALLVPVEIIHHNVAGMWGLALAGVLTVTVLAGATLRLSKLAAAGDRSPSPA
jgi:hypothetical protein